jgi:hypothetical protein
MTSFILKITKFGVLVLITALVGTAPASVFAQSRSLPYQPQTQLELISYLQGVLNTLQAQQYSSGKLSSSLVEKQTAVVSSSIEVELKASFNAKNSSYVNAWFEYGVGNVIDKKTSSVKIRNTERNESIEHARVLKNLEPNTQYVYRPVFELSNGTKYYGLIKNFGTTGSNVSSVDFNSTASGTGKENSRGNSLSTNKTVYEIGEPILVSWTTPKKEFHSGNIIYMFKAGDSYSDSRMGRYANNESGNVNFKVYQKGTYEFRLYLNFSSKEVVESRQVTVR